MRKNLIILAIMIGLTAIFTSCTKDFEHINTDPNNPVEAPSINILANVVRFYNQNNSNAWGDMNEPSSWANHLGKIQYIDEAQYKFRDGVVNDRWSVAYNNINDLDKVIARESEEEGNPYHKAMAMTLRAWIYQQTTDRFGDIPYTEASQGDEGITNPSYDTQESIYTDLLDQLKQANDLLVSSPVYSIASGDVLLGGSVLRWKKFNNSLRLRVAIRISDVAPGLSRTHIEEILGSPDIYPIFESNADNVFLWWEEDGPYRDPWNADSDNRDDHGVAKTLIDQLIDFNDPRLPVYAKPAPNDGEYRGVVSGAIDGTFELNDISRIGTIFRDVPDGFTPIMRFSEVQFIIAEAAYKGWNTGGVTAQEAYEAGITASFGEVDQLINSLLGDDDIESILRIHLDLEEDEDVDVGFNDFVDDYIQEPGVAWTGDVDQIHLQKWLALFKNGNEAWAETRRTDVPLLEHAPGSPYLGQHNRPPFRYPYPVDEINLNSANINPKLQGIVNHMWGNQMWWDTRTGVN